MHLWLLMKCDFLTQPLVVPYIPQHHLIVHSLAFEITELSPSEQNTVYLEHSLLPPRDGCPVA